VQGAVSVAAVDRNKAHAFLPTTHSYIELAAPGRSSRGFGPAGLVFQQTFDPTFTDTFLVAAGAVPRATLRHVGYPYQAPRWRHRT
jgi:hypothetical protein